jgi:hypothetical protein
MRCSAPAFQSALAVVALTLAASLWANPTGYSINSRGTQDINNLWQVDLSTGQETRIGELGNNGFIDVEALALSPAGELYGADDATETLVRVRTSDGFAFSVNSSTGNMQLPGATNYDFGMSFDCSGTLYLVSATEQSLFRADLDTGQLTRVGAAGSLGAPITDIAVRGQEVYGIGVGRSAQGAVLAPNLYSVDLETASSELIGSLGAQADPYNNAGLSFAEDGSLWAMTDRRAVGNADFASQILRIDRATGEAQRVAETIIGMESLAIGPPALCQSDPRPQSIPVLSVPGLISLGMLMLLLAGLRLRSGES